MDSIGVKNAVHPLDTRVTAENINKRGLDEDDVSKKNKQLSIINAFSQPPTINQGMLLKYNFLIFNNVTYIFY